MAWLTSMVLGTMVVLAVGCGDDGGGGGGDPVDAGRARDAGPTADDGGPRDGGPGAPVSCSEYCTEAIASCTGANTIYPSMEACVTYCTTNAGWAQGMRGDVAGNTISCRHYHSNNVRKFSDPDTHCPHSGPSGGNACGTWCENYCQLALRNCTGANQVYASEAECTAACPAIADDGEAGAMSGDSIQCRIYHLGVAGTDAASATMHCPHGSATPTGPCS